MVDDPEAIKESAIAVQEVAKTTSKAIDVGQQFAGFISRFVSGSLEQGMGIVKDKLQYMRWERQMRLMQRANQYLEELGVGAPTKAVPLKFAVPLFQAASLEDDNFLQDKWAKLLVNSSVTTRRIDIKRSYIDILERLSPLEARILDSIYSISAADLANKSVITEGLPETVAIKEEGDKKEYKNPGEVVVLALANLARLGCISLPMTWGGGEIFSTIHPTLIGRAFVEACTLDSAGSS